MPPFSHASINQDAVFTMKTAPIFVLSSLFAFAGAYLALQSMAWVFALAVAMTIFFAALFTGCGKKGAFVFALAFFTAFLFAQDRLSRLVAGPDDLSQLRANVVSFKGHVLTAKIKESDKGRMVSCEVGVEKLLLPYRKEIKGKVLVHIGPYISANQTMPSWGNSYIFSGHLIKPKGKVFSFEFDEKHFLMLKDIYCQVSSTADAVQSVASKSLIDTNKVGNAETNTGADSEKKGSDNCLKPFEDFASGLIGKTELLRQGIVRAHTDALGQERGKLLTSMVLGDRAVTLSDTTKDAFARVGLSHLLAASGLNLTIIVGAVLFVFGLVKKCNRGRRTDLFQTVGALICVLFFVSLAGASPSVTRATIMCLLLLWSSLLFRRLANGAALAGALWLALLFDPLSALDIGLELSYGATFGIIYFYPIFMHSLPRVCSKKPWHWICAISSVVLSAQLAVLPVQISCFQKMSTLVLPANMLAEPLVAPITVLGFISSLITAMALALGWVNQFEQSLLHLPEIVHLLMTISKAVDFFSAWLLDLLLALTKGLGASPLSYIYLARPPAWAVIFYYLVLTIAFVQGLSRPTRGALVAIVAGLVFTTQGVLMSPCLEILLTADRAVIVRPGSAPELLLLSADLPGSQPNGSGSPLPQATNRFLSSSYLPAYHRDFVLSYLHSLSGRGPCLNGFTKPDGQVLWQDKNTDVRLVCTYGGVQAESNMPAAAVAVEEAQHTRLYKFKTWGQLIFLCAKNKLGGKFDLIPDMVQ